MPPYGGPTPSLVPWLFSVGCTALLLAWVPVTELGMPRWQGMVASAWLLAALLSSVIALCQFFDVEQYFYPWMSAAAQGEAFGNLRQRNQFATLCNMGLTALLYGAVKYQASTGWRMPALLLAAALLALGNAVSSSRTGLLELTLLVGMVFYWGWLHQRPARRVLTAAILVYGLATLLLMQLPGREGDGSGIFSRFQNPGPDCASRLIMWRNMLHLISLRPWTGWGWGELDYAHFITAYDGPRHCELVDNAHNLPLHLAVELGLPLALLVCGLAVWLTWRARPWRETDPIRQLAWMVLAVILLHSMLEYPLWYGPFQMAFGLSLGLLWRARQPSTPDVSVTAALGKGQYILAVALLGITAYAAWDYYRISQIYLPPEQRLVAYRDNTLEKIRGSWLFRDQVRFAEFTLTPLTRDNAAQLNAMAHELLHFSPEAQVVEKLIESAVLLGRDDEARFFMVRYRAAYPQAYGRWLGKDVPVDAK